MSENVGDALGPGVRNVIPDGVAVENGIQSTLSDFFRFLRRPRNVPAIRGCVGNHTCVSDQVSLFVAKKVTVVAASLVRVRSGVAVCCQKSDGEGASLASFSSGGI